MAKRPDLRVETCEAVGFPDRPFESGLVLQ